MTQQHLFMRMAGRAYACSASVDDHLHPHPAVPVEAADEVAGAGAKRDAVAPRAVRRAGGPAAVVAAGVHGHHVVHGGVVVELCTRGEKKAMISVCLELETIKAIRLTDNSRK